MLQVKDWRLTALLVFVIAGFIYVAEPLLFPILLALVFFFLLHPLVRVSSRLKIPKVISASVLLLVLTGSGAIAISYLKGPATSWLEQAPRTLSQFERKIRIIKRPIEKIFDATERVEKMTSMDQSNRDVEIKVESPKLGSTVFEVTGSALVTLASSLVLLYFLLIYGERFIQKLMNSGEPSEANKSKGGLRQIEVEISRCFLTVTTINVCLGLTIGTALWLLGVPNPMLWGVMATALNFLPYIGAMTGTAVVAFVSFITFDNSFQTLLPPLAYFVINSIEGQFITPMLLGQRLKINPLLLLLSMMLWGWAWGLKGVLLSVPIMVIVKVVSDHRSNMRKFARLLEL